VSKFHINVQTGETGLCSAKINCPFGSLENDHYPSGQDARSAYEEQMSAKTIETHKSKTSKDVEPAGFQDISETRKLPEQYPILIADHVAMSKTLLESKFSDVEMRALKGYGGFAAGICNEALLNDKSVSEIYMVEDAKPWRETSRSPCEFKSKEDLQDYMMTMDKILSERQSESRVLYRGTPIYIGLHDELEKEIGRRIHVNDTESMLEALSNHYKPGNIVDFPTYVSTSVSAYVAADRTDESSGSKITYYDKPEVRGILYEMKTNAGLDITGVASHDYEREVVLPRDTKFKVESIDLRPESYNTISGNDFLREPKNTLSQNFEQLSLVVKLVEIDENGEEYKSAKPHALSPMNLTD
jgi:hypothetical protein